MAGRYLIAALLLLTAPRVFAAEIEVVQLNNFLQEVRGGSGANAWYIQYGTQFRPSEFQTIEGPGEIAYFSHYNWLRRIDTEKGVVTGRWLFPGTAIVGLSWKDGRLQVEVRTNSDFYPQKNRIYDFDPAHPPVTNAIFSESSRAEALRTRRFVTPFDAERMIPELENTLRRDSFSPWLRAVLGRLYDVTGRPGSQEMIEAAVQLDSAHFSELFDISSFLNEMGQHGAARIAFERGYAQFWRQGQDPRLVSAPVLHRFQIQANTPVALQRELVARTHALTPWIDGAADGWKRYGDYLVSNGDTAEGQLWLARADAARKNGLLLSTDARYFDALAASLIGTTLLAGAILYAVVLFFRYRPQRRARLQAEIAARVSRPGFANVEYWRRSERVSFLVLVVFAWLADGFAGASLLASSGRSISYFYDLRAGTLLSQSSIETIESRLAGSPERDLILAIAYQRDGQVEKAEQLYRSVPQFAESWNNLGVLLKDAGKEVESRKAFERALELRADFPEAEWNLGKPSRGEWVKFHEQFVPDKAMTTVPTRTEMLRAYGLKEGLLEWTKIALGPLESTTAEPNYYYQDRGRLRKGLLIFCLAGGLLLVFFRPRETVVAPPKYQALLELLFPGTARVWGVLGAITLGVGCYFSSAIWPERWAKFYSYFSFGSISRRLPLPYVLNYSTDGQEVFSPIPSFWWLVALLMVNAAVVLLWKWRRK